MAQHTPGPWRIEQSDELLNDERLDRADITAPVPGTQYKTEVARVYCENRKGATVGPNARLIAAAPDLLHAISGDHGDRLTFVASLLMEARHLPLPNGVDWDAWAVTLDEADLFVKEARAAIAKAQGGA